MSRSIVLILLPALIAVGCSDAEPADPGASSSPTSPEAHPLEGAWLLSGRVTQNDFENHGSPNVRERALALTCLDDACASLLQRVSGGHGAVEWTVRVDGTDMSGSHARSGSCHSGKGRYTETMTWNWAEEGDGLAAEAVQTFTGCKLDGTATYALTATAHEPASDLDPPDAATASTVDEALDAYDTSLARVYTKQNGCDPQSWTCPRQAFEDWRSATDALHSALPAAADAPKACASGLERVDTRKLSAALGRLVAAYRAQAGERVTASSTAMLEAAERVHLDLLEVARWCLPADSLATMKAPPAYDTAAALPPMDR